MQRLLQLISSSIGKKLLMALTGLFLCTFLIEHLYGNLLLYVGEDAFNHHAESLTSNVIIRIVEVLLFLTIALHIIGGYWLTTRNRRARPIRYRVKHRAILGTLSSRTMIITGSAILVYLAIHLKQFFYEYRFGTLGEEQSLYHLVATAFTIPEYAAIYAAAMVLLAFHLYHGFQSGFKTLGVMHASYSALIRTVGALFAILVPAGFASLPIYFLIQSLGG